MKTKLPRNWRLSSLLRRSAAAAPRTDGRIDAGCQRRGIGAIGLRISPAAIAALVLPRVDLQIAAVEEVEAADELLRRRTWGKRRRVERCLARHGISAFKTPGRP